MKVIKLFAFCELCGNYFKSGGDMVNKLNCKFIQRFVIYTLLASFDLGYGRV